MSYYEKEALKPLPEASSWPKLSGTGEYDHMQLIDYIDGLLIDVPRIPHYWITSRLNTEFKAKKKVYDIQQVPEEEYPTEDSQSDSMGDAIREQPYDDQDPREEFLVEYQEET
ncbi:hypothetical protein O181_044429 [Austropuccinia psidii MF-1]|uniref:Uncharacterized protein n=1 Tax=Austropuccinia psidii MF-1 TaxID=1389203 RepID=A0A9Q3HJE2_9BASI|nr:hypothetical protein [Austropuccinia psidii MF-1]